MIKKIFIAGLCFIFAIASANAAVQAKTFATAKKKNTKDGILAYFYGPDWDARGTAMLKTFWNSPEIKAACGDGVMLAVPVYQNPSEKDKKRVAEIRAGMRVPHIYSFPAVVMYTNGGDDIHYILTGTEIFEETPKVAETISQKLKLARERKTLWSRADKAKGAEKAKILAQIAETYGEAIFADPDDHIAHVDKNSLKKVKGEILKKLAGTGDERLAKQLNFDIYKLITDKTHRDPDKPDLQLMSKDDAFALVKKLAIDDAETYRPDQRQKLLASCAAYLRREDKDDKRIPGLLKKIIEIDSTNVWASFAEESSRIWHGGVDTDKSKKKKKSRK